MTARDQTLLAAAVFVFMLAICAAGVRADDETKVWLARAMVSECGWEVNDCQAAVAHTLARRARVQKLSLVEMVRSYCAGLGDKPPNKRQARHEPS